MELVQEQLSSGYPPGEGPEMHLGLPCSNAVEIRAFEVSLKQSFKKQIKVPQEEWRKAHQLPNWPPGEGPDMHLGLSCSNAVEIRAFEAEMDTSWKLFIECEYKN